MIQTSEGTLAAGHVVAGRYRVESVLGEGGFGTVFRATQLNLGRVVALKVLHAHLVDDEDGMNRFKREAQLAQRLEHPNTVRLFDFGVEGQTAYIAFEMLKGQPLDALLAREKQLPAARVARMATQVLKSLMEAHGLGIVHRDIKPSNIFLSDFSGEPDFVKVLDFGIAKATHAAGQQTSAGLTRVGEAVGTPSYMSPEQVSGAAISPATDLYALGLVMAEALTGEVVMKGESGIQIVMAQVSSAAVPLPPAVLRSPLGPVIHRATQKDAQRRYASAAEMLAHVEQAMKGAQSAVIAVAAPGAPVAPPQASLPYMQTNVAGYAGPFQHAPSGPPAPHPGSAPPAYAPSGPPPHAGYGYPHAGPAPYGAAPYAPGRALPPPAVRRSSDGTSCGLFVLLASIGLLVVGVIVAAIIAVGLGADAGTAAPGTGAGAIAPASGPISELDLDGLKAKVGDAGWNVLSESSNRQTGVETLQVTVEKDQKYASVSLIKYASERSAEAVEESMRNNESTLVARDGGTVLMVMGMNDRALARELFDAVTR